MTEVAGDSYLIAHSLCTHKGCAMRSDAKNVLVGLVMALRTFTTDGCEIDLEKQTFHLN